MHVILAQESKVIRNVLRGSVKSTRFAEASVADVQNGGDLLRALKYNGDPETLVLLDWNLPGLDVPTFLGHLRRRGMLGPVSVLLSVNAAHIPEAKEALGRGASGYITRPFSDQDLCEKIEEIGRTREIRPAASPSGVLRDIVTTARLQEDLPSLLSLPSGLIADLFEATTKARHEPGAVILRTGERVDSLSFITLGQVEILSREHPSGRVTRGAGECFAERAFVCGEPANLTVRALTAVDVIAVPKESMVELARRHPAVQDFLTALLTRKPEQEGQIELSGTTASLSFPDLLQFLNSTRRTGVLVLETEGRTGRIYVEDGEVIDARDDGGSGEIVFHRLAGGPEARFEFRSGAASGVRTVFQSTMKLLMSSFATAQVG
jgi:two-component system, chemotaxis family, chemotaxis protein CheY